jgi:hypothetical protein
VCICCVCGGAGIRENPKTPTPTGLPCTAHSNSKAIGSHDGRDRSTSATQRRNTHEQAPSEANRAKLRVRKQGVEDLDLRCKGAWAWIQQLQALGIKNSSRGTSHARDMLQAHLRRCGWATRSTSGCCNA